MSENYNQKTNIQSDEKTKIEIKTTIENQSFITKIEPAEDSTMIDDITIDTYKRKKNTDPFIGERCGENEEYLIVKFIAKGGMGNIYLCVNESETIEDDFVVVKFLDKECLEADNKQEIIDRFRREIKLLSSLNHPNIVNILDQGIYQLKEHGKSYDIPFFVMEYLQGETLSDYLIKTQKISLQESLCIITQILAGLRIAHNQGVIHRDLKPDNIFLIPTLNNKHIVKILDFGIARKVDSMSVIRLTKMNDYFASPYYISPEHIYGVTELDARSDIYNLGLIFYEIITGNKPFTDYDDLLVTKGWLGVHNLKLPIPPNQQIDCEKIPLILNNIILKCLAKNPNDRFQNSEEILAKIINIYPEYSILSAEFNGNYISKKQFIKGLVLSFFMGISLTSLILFIITTITNNVKQSFIINDQYTQMY
ncbi:serine/threonine protein kinase [Cyanobacterium stanieri LEGE 03274]|uniref:Serine/threonine protein kinase n=1 Tax=Cyanobacterium stanieri LEGE 03274 TaxID=1828756 RepID=A0ABR9V0C4_9CHRO|nr:serine/threonine-protein kinase [Cyanobacterium stanieri]MBE9221336.1 serine/threonine protein kinase [Cyanobacterium stanieri LEGE 03274]